MDFRGVLPILVLDTSTLPQSLCPCNISRRHKKSIRTQAYNQNMSKKHGIVEMNIEI